MNLPIKVKLTENGKRAGINPTPKYDKDGESGLELYVLTKTIIEPFQQAKLPHGFAMEIPYGYEGQIRPRSSSYEKKGVEIILGTIDANYRGEMTSSILYRPPVEGIAGSWVEKMLESENEAQAKAQAEGQPLGVVLVHIVRSITIAMLQQFKLARIPHEPLVLNPGDRVSQLVIAPVVYADIQVVDELSDTQRGERGFGESTGGHS